MVVPSSVIWQVIKGNNSYLVKRGRDGEQWTRDPLSITNRFNASENGISNFNAISITASQESAKKTHRRVFNLNIKHAGHHNAKSTSGSVFSKTSIKKDVNRLAKVVNSLQGITDSHREKLLARVYKLHSGNKLHQRQYKSTVEATE